MAAVQNNQNDALGQAVSGHCPLPLWVGKQPTPIPAPAKQSPRNSVDWKSCGMREAEPFIYSQHEDQMRV